MGLFSIFKRKRKRRTLNIAGPGGWAVFDGNKKIASGSSPYGRSGAWKKYAK
jgi:hypothetical protein